MAHKHKLSGEDKADAFGETVSDPSVRTGALSISSSKTKTENDDIFGVAETARPRRVTRPKPRGEGATGEDGGVFEEKIDDDESDAELHHDEPQGLESDSDKDEFEVDPEGTGKLTETGQAMKDLLKRAQNGEMLENNKDKEDEDDDEEDENFTAMDMDVIKRDLGGTSSATFLLHRAMLIRYGGRMRTRDLLRKLKKLIVTDNDKALLKDILRTICDVEVDAIDARLLVLKSQFR
ncbi:hypothetical protein PsorP6_005489 [Peronosclerospora sorghi]|uniref:Uncharacterized protein n=1 Tax=Peronosclerospora sorghi TaxID=230839 RepID=A0ACC0W6J2_9STRA|nr:hypothetical protein PsorP6_005489 [Peronosclerospora sorghi]